MAPGRTRVAYVIGELGKGGAEYQLVELLRGLDRTAVDPHVVALSAGGFWAGEIRALGIPLVELPSRGHADVARLRALRETLRALAPDVLHTILWSANSYGRLAAAGLRVPRVIAAERNVMTRPAWERAIERALDRVTDLYLVNARAVADELVRHGLPRGKMRVVYNGVDLTRFPAFDVDRRAARAALGLPADRRLLAQVGRLAPQKDYPTFLRAAAALAERFSDLDVLVVGEGPLRADLERLAATLGLGERVRWLGLRHDVPRILAAVDVMLLTSRFEGLPNVVIEAMGAGAAVVATDAGGTRELVLSDAYGTVAAPGDVHAIVEGATRFLADESRRAAVARTAHARVETELSTAAMVRATCALYAEGAQGRTG
jgi:glycosyltransferase involved in cell wall biosynthesis